MSEPKWTKKPWHAKICEVQFRRPRLNDDYQIITDDKIVPAIVWEFGDTGRANAQLVAAAPELYDDLELLTRQCQTAKGALPEDIRQKILKTVDQAKQTLAKARGENEN